MLKDLSADHIYIVCGHTDMRKSIDGLAAIIQQQYQLDLFSNSAFLFCGRRRNRMKVLLWEDSGFLLLYKRLENGKFSWPRNEQEVRDLTYEQYIWLLQGLSVDQPKAIKKMPDGIPCAWRYLEEISANNFVTTFRAGSAFAAIWLLISRQISYISSTAILTPSSARISAVRRITANSCTSRSVRPDGCNPGSDANFF